MNTFEDIQNLIQNDINKTDQVLIEHLGSNVALINQMSGYIINAGGKRLRPLLLLLCARATHYQGEHHHLMAVVIELIHTATLLHDDIVDESKSRRGKETANKVWGNAASVLVGDFLYSRAFEMMVKSDSMRIMTILSKATNEIAQGEVLQLLNCQNSALTEEEYYQVIERKTAVLFQAATQIGGLLSNIDKVQEQALKNYGLHLGNAFQIIDDVLDYQSNAETMGKEVGDDLSEGKTTLPIIYALKNTVAKDRQLLKDAINNADNSKIEQVLGILQSVNAFDYTRKQAQKSANLAKKSLDSLQDSKYKEALILLCDLSLQRKS
ncbi:Octaprenyl diphosphate synthase (EC [uncultured Gammaproteobacteria bacterium]|jgi:octaprenyl-diphosphate synthase|uniref:polyprenyl synthetase family protein n=1 Tax=thiotrophic endosymbiont of Bathymodiolus puteoserpentis (Logatchev) TaxID=343240 RepID=UPI0010B2EA25|nr:polyprenyl synthetase family protein [thiotrophic endosymbiont of Bathymodiolus puteoserpentis (Logatchev)]CAC9577870.1 Octaprenyl diphosphate synthase (EC 2.5.1.90) [uncultured Gammaproteobacteria bacterium]CAC9579400.1 Octaprenyl diphosphate synthase (EC 2.5.1.90) [uncultured Gammaproteobacteria bacterium]CAC9584253.1 Octaprenyl diphosphate synthase (EC 2.5.1.90) [uncultured Gammaproteobacteria bacterium]CAC9590798.1 Octaprenyl diphosphate synthase (EC 2.5.1.90) [uncultured Gammaproteobact